MVDTDIAPECPEEFSLKIAKSATRLCGEHGLPPGQPMLTLNSVTQTLCWSRCGAQAGVIAVETPAGARWTSQLRAGDAVLAAGPELEWRPAPLAFSAGMSLNQAETEFIVLRFDAHPADGLCVLGDQVFLDRTGGLVRARDLVEGDWLRTADGGACRLANVAPVLLPRGFAWPVATSAQRPQDLNDHLLSTQGLVTGDYAVQLFFDDFVAAGLAHRPPRMA